MVVLTGLWCLNDQQTMVLDSCNERIEEFIVYFSLCIIDAYASPRISPFNDHLFCTIGQIFKDLFDGLFRLDLYSRVLFANF